MTKPSLTDMTPAQLADTVFARRAAYQRALSAVKARGDDEMFDASVAHLLGDVQAMRGVPLVVTMFAATVTDRAGGFDIRGVWATRAIAIQRLEMEVASKSSICLTWESYGAHAVSQCVDGLQYHVDPVEVNA